MWELLLLASIVIVVLASVLGWTTYTQGRERRDWATERRYLIDRAISRHVGEVVALEREEAKRNHPTSHESDRSVRPLLEGLS